MGQPVLIGLLWWMILLGVMGFGACGDDGDVGGENAEPRDFVYPDPEWTVETPEAHGLDSSLLLAAADFADAHRTDCLLVARDGVIVGEWYWNGWDEDDEDNVFSVSKSITSALVGIAQDRGDLDIREKASNYITEWIGTESEDVTIQNLISNDSGRHWDFWTDYVRNYLLAADKTSFAIGLGQQYDPGTVWRYNNSAIQTLERVLSQATGMDVAQYAEAYLFEPLGMASRYGRDPAGNPMTFSNVSASCRDLARFGYLYLREGRWNDDEQVVPVDWVEASLRPSTPLNSAYGYMWWLNRSGRWMDSVFHRERYGKPLPDLPDSVFRASGAFNQIIFVDPGMDVVFTRIGWVASIVDAVTSDFVEGLAERIRAARLDSTLP